MCVTVYNAHTNTRKCHNFNNSEISSLNDIALVLLIVLNRMFLIRTSYHVVSFLLNVYCLFMFNIVVFVSFIAFTTIVWAISILFSYVIILFLFLITLTIRFIHIIIVHTHIPFKRFDYFAFTFLMFVLTYRVLKPRTHLTRSVN